MKYLSVIKYCICTCVDGKIGANVKYRVDPLPDGLYVCLDPREGLVFAGGLTYKINNGSESSLHGHGMYACTNICNIVNCAIHKCTILEFTVKLLILHTHYSPHIDSLKGSMQEYSCPLKIFFDITP